jgi:hypothetical protein
MKTSDFTRINRRTKEEKKALTVICGKQHSLGRIKKHGIEFGVLD